MKRIFTILAAVLMTATVWGQSPEKMSYQAVIRNSSNALVTSTNVGMQISILQGSETGTVVYTETQTTSTNANGLVSLEIGSGTVVSGTFATIDLANGPYFIKTETDPTGGTNYTIAGTSQLLSVPYALHAKTAEIVTETDPIYTGSEAASITATDITNLGNLSNINTGDQDLSTLATTTALGDSTAQLRSEIPAVADGSETQVTAGTNVSVTGSGTTASPYVVNATGATALAIGDSYQGGIIFWLDATGQHGLIAATADQSTGIQWYNGTYRYTGTTGDGLYAGSMNTAMIVATQMSDNQTGNFAAKVCADYSVTVGGVIYGDWYLPSKYELNLLYLQKAVVGGFASAYYWSSSEDNSYFAWAQNFGSGSQGNLNKIVTAHYVRAVRAF
jgi:hypothetical protein